MSVFIRIKFQESNQVYPQHYRDMFATGVLQPAILAAFTRISIKKQPYKRLKTKVSTESHMVHLFNKQLVSV